MKRWVSSILLLCLAVLCFAQGDVFRVVSITDLGDGRLDVKLYNERTHYIHSETISIDIGWAIGDLINIIVDSQGRRSFKKVGQAGQGVPGNSQPPTGSRPAAQQPQLKGGVSASAPKSSSPANNSPLDYVRGLAEGLGDCVHGFIDVIAAAGMIAQAVDSPIAGIQTNWVDVAKLLGVEPGQSIVLRELNRTKIIGQNVSAFDRGKIDGRRLCAYGAVPGLGKAARAAPFKAIATAGETPVNPMRGAALSKAMTAGESELPGLSGKWVWTPWGSVKLGEFLGKGSFATAFERADNPGRVIKIGNDTGESGPSFTRQVLGAQRLGQAGVDTPAIRYSDPGAATRPGELITDNVNTRGPPGSVLKLSTGEIRQMPAAQQAMQDVFNKIAQKGYAWADGHGGNVRFVSDGVGGLKAVVIDPDFVMTPQEYAASIRDGSMPGRVLGGKLFATEGLQDWADLQKGKQVSAQQLSDSLFQAQFGEPDILPRVTNGVTVPRK